MCMYCILRRNISTTPLCFLCHFATATEFSFRLRFDAIIFVIIVITYVITVQNRKLIAVNNITFLYSRFLQVPLSFTFFAVIILS